MNGIFFTGEAFRNAFTGGMGGGFLAALVALGIALAIFLILLLIAFYVLASWAFMSLAKKVKYPSPGIAWIPIIGPAIILSKTAKMHW